MPEIRDLVHTIKSTDLTPAQIEAGFGEIYLSKDTIPNQLEVQEIVDQFRSVKLPTYGAHIPNTSIITRTAGASGIFSLVTVDENKAYKIQAISVESASANPHEIQIGLFDGQSDFAAFYSGEAVPAGVTAIADIVNMTFDSTIYPAALIADGDVNDFTFRIAFCEIVQ